MLLKEKVSGGRFRKRKVDTFYLWKKISCTKLIDSLSIYICIQQNYDEIQYFITYVYDFM